MDDIEEGAYLYICGASKETCRDLKISDTVFDFMELIKDNKGIISNMTLHEEVRKVLGIIHKARACTFQTTIDYNIKGKKWEIINHLGKPNSLLPVFKPEMINKQFWNQLRQRYNLQCAYLNVQGKFTGCINDYLNQSKCTTFQK